MRSLRLLSTRSLFLESSKSSQNMFPTITGMQISHLEPISEISANERTEAAETPEVNSETLVRLRSQKRKFSRRNELDLVSRRNELDLAPAPEISSLDMAYFEKASIAKTISDQVKASGDKVAE